MQMLTMALAGLKLVTSVSTKGERKEMITFNGYHEGMKERADI